MKKNNFKNVDFPPGTQFLSCDDMVLINVGDACALVLYHDLYVQHISFISDRYARPTVRTIECDVVFHPPVAE